jgi:hypothetical protein
MELEEIQLELEGYFKEYLSFTEESIWNDIHLTGSPYNFCLCVYSFMEILHTELAREEERLKRYEKELRGN